MDFYFSIFERLQKKIDVPFKQEGKWLMNNEDQTQVKAIKEALVNLLMHTDYFSNAKPRIRVFLDRIEFFNPGSLPKDVKYIMQEEFSMPRNRTVARIFRHIGLSENIGSGFDKMFKGWASYYKHKPKVSGDFDYYKIVFYLEPKSAKSGVLKKVGERVGEGLGVKLGAKLGVKLGVNEAKIIGLIMGNKFATIVQIAEELGISTTAVENNISKLRENGILKREGSDKTGHWEVLKEG